MADQAGEAPAAAMPPTAREAGVNLVKVELALIALERGVEGGTLIGTPAGLAEFREVLRDAAATVRAGLDALFDFCRAQSEASAIAGKPAVTEKGNPAPEPAGFQAHYRAVVAALELLDAFPDVRKSGAGIALAQILDMLCSVQMGISPDGFIPAREVQRNRAMPPEGQRIVGWAAATVDARVRSGMRPSDAFLEVAALLRSVRLTRGAVSGEIKPSTLRDWWLKARRGELAVFAQATFGRYVAATGASGPLRGSAPPQQVRDWETVAKSFDGFIARDIASRPSDFTLSGGAREKRRPRGRDEAD